MERKVHIGNKWWKIMTIYSTEMKTTRRRVEDAMKENREDCILLRGDFNGRIGEKGARNWEDTNGMDGRKWMGGTEQEQTRNEERGWTYR
jgi:hypothetical protein